ncbi:Asp-tRNA(Asn)/Glu-tRNA(Gln) amidotransferase subunit GatC [Candidatus Woesearchaeota archaeon]|nr:Asp-tRNA(Asn)/Glu-tRNA(Gln) amidotransferase subunit GatC [Candidatus Woesearchaeota archaeon]
MIVNKELIKKVAATAKLELTEQELEEFIPQFEEILKTFSKLAKADTKNVLPSFHPVPLKNRMRDDTIHSSLSQEQALSLTEHKKDGYFKGPKVV